MELPVELWTRVFLFSRTPVDVANLLSATRCLYYTSRAEVIQKHITRLCVLAIWSSPGPLTDVQVVRVSERQYVWEALKQLPRQDWSLLSSHLREFIVLMVSCKRSKRENSALFRQLTGLGRCSCVWSYRAGYWNKLPNVKIADLLTLDVVWRNPLILDTGLGSTLHPDSHKLGFMDGLYNFETRSFSRTSPSDLMVFHADFPYQWFPMNHESIADVRRYLNSVLPDHDVCQRVVRKLANAIAGRSTDGKVLYFWGNAGGVTTFVNFLLDTIPTCFHMLQRQHSLKDRKARIKTHLHYGIETSIGRFIRRACDDEDVLYIFHGFYGPTNARVGRMSADLMERSVDQIHFPFCFCSNDAHDNPAHRRCDINITVKLATTEFKQAFMHLLIETANHVQT